MVSSVRDSSQRSSAPLVTRAMAPLPNTSISKTRFMKRMASPYRRCSIWTADLDGGLIVRDTDYWDSRELGESDMVGPADTTNVAVPLGAVHPGGVAAQRASAGPSRQRAADDRRHRPPLSLR